jgi:Zn finger protein HypA/HybF involved in hydrogenase expression
MSNERRRSYVKCWNCNCQVDTKLLHPDNYDGECPMCEAEGLSEET